jgi:hypothetical protein
MFHQSAINSLNYNLSDCDLICYVSVDNSSLDMHKISTGDFIQSFDSVVDAEYEMLTA